MADLKVLTALSASSGVAVSGSAGLIVQQGGLTVSSGVTSVGALTASSAELTTADINGGTIDGVSIGATTQAAGKFTTISGSSNLDVAGAAALAGGVTVTGAALNASAVAVSASALNVTNAADVGSLTVGGGYGSTGVSVSAAGNIQANGTLTVDSTSTLTGDVTFGGNIVADANENKSIFAAVTSQTITIGAAGTQISLPGTASVGGNLTISGDLTVNGTTTTVSSQNVTIKDKNVILGVPDGGATATDAGADGGGITLSGSTDKTFQWSNTTDSWTSSEHLDLASGKAFKIATVDVIKQANILSNSVTNASILTSGSANAFFAVGSMMGGDSAVISGSSILAAAPQMNIGPSSIAGSDPEIFIENQAVRVSAALTVVTGSGQTFTNLNGDITSGYINVVDALHTLDGLVNGGATVSPTAYYGLRTVVSGTKQGNSDSIVFTISGSANGGQGGNTPSGAGLTNMSSSNAETLISLMGGMSIDVAIKAVNTTTWTNDLVSVQVTASALSDGFYWPKITVDAPSLASNSVVRLIVVNENENVIQ